MYQKNLLLMLNFFTQDYLDVQAFITCQTKGGKITDRMFCTGKPKNACEVQLGYSEAETLEHAVR